MTAPWGAPLPTGLFDLIRVRRRDGVEAPRSFEDYSVEAPQAGPLADLGFPGVTLTCLVTWTEEGLLPEASEAFDEGKGIVVPVSALEHWSYCPRQCALIHLEQTFEENIFTIRGQLAHERIEAADREIAQGVPVLRSVPVWSPRYGLRGKADVVELQPEGPYPVQAKVSPAVRPGQVIVYHVWENYQFRGDIGYRNVTPSPINPVELAGDYLHLRPAPAILQPGQSDRATRVEVEKA